jgi:glycosyltransferase involved in cell wall biosynthesis
MRNSASLLSICIPTYNRAALLRECLDSILVSARGYEDQVEIVISDNASTDDTHAVVAEFQRQCPQVCYHRHTANIGAENNFYVAAQIATGEYLWLFGDDDKMLPNAIPVVLRHLQQSYDLIISNFSVWTNDLSAVKLKNAMPLRRDVVFNDPNQLLASLGAQLSYISAVVIRKTLFLTPPRAEYDRFAEYGLAFLYVVYAGVATRCHGLYLSNPLFCNRDNPRGWSEQLWNRSFITGTQAVFARLRQLGYTAAAIRAADDCLLRDYVLRTILGRVRDGKSALPLLKLMQPRFKRHWFFWGVCIPAAFLPPPMLQLMTRLVRWRRATRGRAIHSHV